MLAVLVGPSGFSLWLVRTSAILSPLSREITEEVETKKRYPRRVRDEGESREWAGMFGPTSVSQREEVTTHKGKRPIFEEKVEKERGWGYWAPH